MSAKSDHKTESVADSVPPIVLHIPHASVVIPEEVRQSFLLTDAELEHELFRLTDHFTDELFAVSPNVARTVVYPVSRMVCDPERFVQDENEPASQFGF